ncbi:MAG TPA: fenitrothion hydrolase [Solirubrobacteraceae bacterium]|nr:fenitrothion hydrolase [Solirubrobacteraceae bacterium]
MPAAARNRAARRVPALLGGALVAVLAGAEPAAAHGLVQRADLPIPEEWFVRASAVVLAVSFVALAALWPTPKLERPRWRPLPRPLDRWLCSRPLLVACRAIGVLLLALTIASGFAGPAGPQDNFAPTFVYVVCWVGFAVVSVLLGNVFRAFNPWLAVGRLLPSARRPYPERLGHWPAVAGLAAFVWMELASGHGEDPRNVATAAAVYTVLTLAAMARYGADAWAERGETFGVYFGLLSRISPLEARDGRVGVRPPLSGLAEVRPRPGLVALLAVMIGSTTFDGFSQGSAWRDVEPELSRFFESAGASLDLAATLAATLGLLAAIAAVATFYVLGIAGARTVKGSPGAERLRGGFVHSLVPIAVVYVIAHYLTFLIFQGQAIAYLASDPLGQGWDLFGTADSAIDFSVISQNATWYAQVGAVVLGHVAALTLAHDRALTLYRDGRTAVRSQVWMLLIMIGFTTLALWLLMQANA